MRHHLVGMRCKECTNAAPIPTYRISRGLVVRGIAVAVALGLGCFVALSLISSFFNLGIFFFVLLAGAGYLIGEGVSAAVNRRRGRVYQYIAASGALLATLPVFWSFILLGSGVSSLFALAGVTAAAYVAANRLAP